MGVGSPAAFRTLLSNGLLWPLKQDAFEKSYSIEYIFFCLLQNSSPVDALPSGKSLPTLMKKVQ